MKKKSEADDIILEKSNEKNALEEDEVTLMEFLSTWPKTAFYTTDLADIFGMSIFRAKAALKELQEQHKVTQVGVTFDGTVKWTSLQWRQ